MKFEQASLNINLNQEILKHKGNRSFGKALKLLSEDDKNHLRSEINLYYFEKEWGLKIMARNVFGLTYTKCRTLFEFLNIQYRTGKNVVTKNLGEFRRQKTLAENKEGIGFNNPEIKKFAKTTNRGVQGYYFNKSTNSYVWLRSTYEFIYAKFLNKIGVNWKTEQSVYKLSDGVNYTPDFFIYDEIWNLTKIVEIKGFWDGRAYKPALLKKDIFEDSNIDIILIKDIELYIEHNTNYEKELSTWKTIRKSKEQKLKE